MASGRSKVVVDSFAKIRELLGGEVKEMHGLGYNPVNKPQIPFEEAYPNGARYDETGRLTYTMDGDPIGNGYVVGRTQVGGGDTGLPESAYDDLATQTTGGPATVESIRPTKSGDVYGTLQLNSLGEPVHIGLSNKLSAEKLPNVYAHELSHAIDEIAGQIKIDGIEGQLRYVYNDINNDDLADARALYKNDDIDLKKRKAYTGVTPERLKYKADDVPREYITESIRAYIQNPNYLKTVAPDVARRIRESVNKNSKLKDIIQFNSVAGATYLAAAAMTPENAEAAAIDQAYNDYLRDELEANTAADTFTEMRSRKAGYWEQRRQELLEMVDGLGELANDVVLPALDKPLQG